MLKKTKKEQKISGWNEMKENQYEYDRKKADNILKKCRNNVKFLKKLRRQEKRK